MLLFSQLPAWICNSREDKGCWKKGDNILLYTAAVTSVRRTHCCEWLGSATFRRAEVVGSTEVTWWRRRREPRTPGGEVEPRLQHAAGQRISERNVFRWKMCFFSKSKRFRGMCYFWKSVNMNCSDCLLSFRLCQMFSFNFIISFLHKYEIQYFILYNFQTLLKQKVFHFRI